MAISETQICCLALFVSMLIDLQDIVSNFLLHTPGLDDAAVGDYLSDGCVSQVKPIP